jgi:hypothetical protein
MRAAPLVACLALFASGGCHIIAGFSKLTLRDKSEANWSRALGDKGSQEVRALGTVGEQAIAAGTFSGTVDFDGIKLAANGTEDGYIATLGPDGRFTHAVKLSATPLGTGQFVRPLAAGGSFVGGLFSGTLATGGTPLATTAGQNALFVTNVDLATGKLASAWKLGGDGFGLPHDKLAIVPDASGNVLVAGGYKGTLDFGAASPCAPYKCDGENLFFAKLDAKGACVWAVHNPDDPEQSIDSIAVDPSTKTIVVGGEFTGKINFANGSAPQLKSVGAHDFFLAHFGFDGKADWTKRFGDGSHVQSSARVAAGPYGAVALAGLFDGKIDLGGGQTYTSSEGHDIIVAKFGLNGDPQWSKQFAVQRTPCTKDCDLDRLGLAFDPGGSLIVAGAWHGTIDIDGVTLTTDSGDVDFFLAKFDGEGHLLWTGNFGDNKNQCEEPHCHLTMAVDSASAILLGGYFENSVDFGAGLLTAAGDRDGFVAKFAP